MEYNEKTNKDNSIQLSQDSFRYESPAFKCKNGLNTKIPAGVMKEDTSYKE